jgi:hypothetical protein
MSEKEILVKAQPSSPVPLTHIIGSWDTSEIYEGQKQYLMEEDEDTKAKLKSGELTVEQLEKDIWNDQDFWDREYEDMCQNLSSDIKKISPKGYFKATVTGFGWRNLDGQNVFHADNGREFLSHILPNCDCTFMIFSVEHGKKLAITNAHHDSPVLYKEWYVITSCSERTYNQFKGR